MNRRRNQRRRRWMVRVTNGRLSIKVNWNCQQMFVQRLGKSYGLTCRQAESVEPWNRHSWTILLKPCIRPGLTTEFFICIARSEVLPNPVGQRKPNHQLLPLRSIFDIGAYADIEASMNPVLGVHDLTGGGKKDQDDSKQST